MKTATHPPRRELGLLLGAVARLEVADAASALAAAGLRVFPLHPGQKAPLIEHGFLDASLSPRQVERWWRRWPEANVGLVTGRGLSVLDVDVHADRSGYPTLAGLQGAGLVQGWIAAVRSPSGGLHLYFPTAENEPRRWLRPGSHIDFLGEGGYVLTPPSRLRGQDGSTASYTVIAARRDGSPVDADAIRELLTPSPRPTADRVVTGDSADSVMRLARWVAALPEGSRNSGLFWAACRTAELGVDASTVLAEAAMRTGLDAREAAMTIGSAYRIAGPEARASIAAAASLHAGMRR